MGGVTKLVTVCGPTPHNTYNKITTNSCTGVILNFEVIIQGYDLPVTCKQERNNQYVLENCMTENISEKLTRMKYFKKVCFKFSNEQF